VHRAAYIELDDRLCYVELVGDPEAPPLLCIHTAGQSGVQFRRVAPGLAALGLQVVIVDMPGHGRSEPAVDGPISDLGWYGDWCLRVLDHLGLERPYVLGCSIGGSIVMDIATKASASLAGVVAMAAADPHTMPGRPARPNVLEDASSPSIRDRTYFGALESVGRSVPAERVEMIALMHCREDWHVTFCDGSAMGRLFLWEKLPTITCPMVVVAGEDDPFTNPARIEETAARIPGAHYEMLPGVGHYPMEDMAEEFPAKFAQWLELLKSPLAVAAGDDDRDGR
jgi:pimeloyl-ACP methyl ester carboxylesterase